jgi:Domain of unknown function (DUF4440)
MKRCSTCNRTYTDPNLSFCIDDGTPLTVITEDETTVVSPQARDTSSGTEWNPAPYQPPRGYVPPGTDTKRRRVWPWLVGLAAFFILGIFVVSLAALFLVPAMRRPAERGVVVENKNSNRSVNSNVEVPANTNNDTTANTNTDPVADTDAPPPTDHAQVLAQLTEIENEWTVANFKADKRKLSRILADDYAGPDEKGYPQTKAEYLRTIRPASLERYQFYDLTLELTGDRAKLSGRATFVSGGQESELLFTDKFVWREGRWQATGSQVGPVQ